MSRSNEELKQELAEASAKVSRAIERYNAAISLPAQEHWSVVIREETKKMEAILAEWDSRTRDVAP
jgi:hypothetical protein